MILPFNFVTFALLLLAVLLSLRTGSAQCVRFASQCPSSTVPASGAQCVLRVPSGFETRCSPAGCFRVTRFVNVGGVRCITPATPPPPQVLGASAAGPNDVVPDAPQGESSSTLPILPPFEDTGIPVLPPVVDATQVLPAGGCATACLPSFEEVSRTCSGAGCKVVGCSRTGGLGYNCVASNSPGMAVLPGNPTDVLAAPASTNPPATTVPVAQTLTADGTSSTAAPITSSTATATSSTTPAETTQTTTATEATTATVPTEQTATTAVTEPTDSTAGTAPIAVTEPPTTFPLIEPENPSNVNSPREEVAGTGSSSGGGAVLPGNPATIYFAGTSITKLFVNGVEVAEVTSPGVVQTYETRLSEGDVVALATETGTGLPGVSAAIDMDGAWTTAGSMATGDKWSVQPLLNYPGVDEWKMSGYDDCGWPVPTVGSAAPSTFPSDAGGINVWTEDGDAQGGLFLRHEIGAEDCPPDSDFFTSTIVFAAVTPTSVFVNGQFRAQSLDPNTVVRFNTLLSEGDAVAFEAKQSTDADFGVIAAIKTLGIWTSTGEPRDRFPYLWRGTGASTVTGAGDWKESPFPTSCSWDSPVTLEDPRGDFKGTKAADFPFTETWASYVWFRDSDPLDRFYFVRHIGMNPCPEKFISDGLTFDLTATFPGIERHERVCLAPVADGAGNPPASAQVFTMDTSGCDGQIDLDYLPAFPRTISPLASKACLVQTVTVPIPNCSSFTSCSVAILVDGASFASITFEADALGCGAD